jgi:hypothetical protein
MVLRHPRFHLHFTPTSASWMNLVERRSAHRDTLATYFRRINDSRH